MASTGDSKIKTLLKTHTPIKPSIRVGVWNEANAQRDENFRPLWPRILFMIRSIRTAELDVLVLLEANRPSCGKSWTKIAKCVDQLTGLKYAGVKAVNATAMAFGKAVFYNPQTVFLTQFSQIWLNDLDPNDFDPLGGSGFGSDLIRLDIHPLAEDGRVILDAPLKAGFVHFPMGRKERMACTAATALIAMKDQLDLVMGDFNTFPDDGGPEMLALLETWNLHSAVKFSDITFQAFTHDLIKKDAAFAEQLNPQSKIISTNEDGTINVLFASPLDHIVTPTYPRRYQLDESIISEVDHSCSDHALMIAKMSLVQP